MVKRTRELKTHPDGTACPEGSRRVPRTFVPCCESFERHTSSCFFDFRLEWWARQKAWFIIIAPSAGGGGLQIAYCPFCGRHLASG